MDDVDYALAEVRFCTALLRKRIESGADKRWLWEIKLRIAEHFLRWHPDHDRPAKELSCMEQEFLRRSHPLLRDLREPGVRPLPRPDREWRENLRQRMVDYLARVSAPDV